MDHGAGMEVNQTETALRSIAVAITLHAIVIFLAAWFVDILVGKWK
jgi:hypothetical protein